MKHYRKSSTLILAAAMAAIASWSPAPGPGGAGGASVPIAALAGGSDLAPEGRLLAQRCSAGRAGAFPSSPVGTTERIVFPLGAAFSRPYGTSAVGLPSNPALK